jgi:DNA polymerase III epsilon subunit-like protein
MRFGDLRLAVIIDVETTGLKPDKDRVVSLAAIKVDFASADMWVKSSDNATANLNFTTWHEVFDPGVRISPRASQINGFTNESVKGKPRFADKARELRDFIGDLPIVAHNIRFDGSFLDAELERAGVPPLRTNPRLCTMMEAHRRACLFHGEDVKWPKLSEAAIYAGVEFAQSDVHDALEDAICAVKLTVGFMNTDFTADGRPVHLFRPSAVDRTAVAEPPRAPPREWIPNWPEEPEAPEPPRKKSRVGRFALALVAAAVVLLGLLLFDAA